MKINSTHSPSLVLAALTLTLGLAVGCDKGDASKSGPDKAEGTADGKAADDKAVDDKAVDDKAVDDKAVDDEDVAQPAAANVIDDQSIITGVNRPGDGSFDTFEVHSGDKIVFANYTPSDNDKEVGISSELKYNMFMLTQPDGQTQAFVVWSPEDPVWQDRLSKTNTVVTGIGSPGPNQIKRGDKARISVQDAEGGGWDVTLDVFRGQSSVATFSFVVK